MIVPSLVLLSVFCRPLSLLVWNLFFARSLTLSESDEPVEAQGNVQVLCQTFRLTASAQVA